MAGPEMPAGQGTVRWDAPPLFERAAEVAALRAILDAADRGNGRFVAIEGSAGIGKTRLAGETQALARASGFEVLTARGGELEGEFGFGIVRQLFEPALATLPPEERLEMLSGAAELAAPLVAGSAALSQESVAEPSFAMLHGLYWLAANFALRRSTLLVVEDLHWVDEPSLRLLSYLARRLDGLSLVVLVTSRPPEEARLPALVGDLLRDPLAVVIRPAVLGEESVAAMARERLGREPDAAFAAALRTASGGNPLYVVALLDVVAREEIIPASEQVARVLALGPAVITREVESRLARLSAEAAELARAAAVLGDLSSLQLAGQLADLEMADAGRAARELARAGLLRGEEPIEFSHPVVRTAILGGLDPASRSGAHRRAAEILLTSGASVELAAVQLLNVLPNGDDFAVDVLRRAAGKALNEGAPGSAVSFLSRALEEPPGEAQVDVLAELGHAEKVSNVPAAIEHLAAARAGATTPDLRAEVALEEALALWLAGRPGAAVELLRGELERSETTDPDLRERLVADIVFASMWDVETHGIAIELLSTVREATLAGAFGSDCVLAVMAERELDTAGDRCRAVDLAERSLASGRLVRSRGFALFSAIRVLAGADKSQRLEAILDAALRSSREVGDIPAIALLVLFRASLTAHLGDLVRAESEIDECLEIVRGHELLNNTERFATALAACIAIERGRLDEAEASLEAVPITDEMALECRYFLVDAGGRLSLARLRMEQALSDFLAIGEILEALGICNPAVVPWRSRAAFALHALGRPEEAQAQARSEVEVARRWGAPSSLGASLCALGLVTEGAPGISLLQEAVEVLEHSEGRLEYARALAGLGAALRRANKRSAARPVLRDAIEVAHACGAVPLVERASEELAATGARPRRILLSGRDSLTASERRVAQLAAEGLANKEIAQTLFVTVKTVEVHLSNSYRKLGIRSRRELADALGVPAPVGATPNV